MRDTNSGRAGIGCAALESGSGDLSAQASERRYVVVDGYNGAVSDFDLTVTCN